MAITRLGLGGFTRGLYGSFTGKSESIPEEPDISIPIDAVPDTVLAGTLSSVSFLGQGVLMYAKDNSYYLLNPEGDTADKVEEQTIELIQQRNMLKEQLRLLNMRIEEAYNTGLNEGDLD